MVRYCPDGDGEFEVWIVTCPECGRALVDDPAEAVPSIRSDLDLVWLTTAPNQPEAEMWADTLRGEGIQVLLQSGGPGFGAWASVVMFEHQLFVHRNDLRKARELVRALLDVSGAHRMNVPRRKSRPRVNPVVRSR